MDSTWLYGLDHLKRDRLGTGKDEELDKLHDYERLLRYGLCRFALFRRYFYKTRRPN